MITVGLPVYNMKEIAWLVMESLCRQQTSDPWELIIFEEEHKGACGDKFFNGYKGRLTDAGCVRLTYMTAKEKKPLSYKWIEIAKKADIESKMFCICGADNYYQRFMVQDAADAYNEGHDWVTTRVGYFYNLLSDRMVKFDISGNPHANTGLQMAVSTNLIRNIPYAEKHKLIDNWMFNSCKPKRKKALMKNFDSLATHGYNNISKNRGKMIDKHMPPFYKTAVRPADILPEDVEIRLRKLIKTR